jgi:hypothetical protein
MTTAQLDAGARARRRGQVRARAHNWTAAGRATVRTWTARARGWRLHLAAPGVAGAGLVSAGLALRFGIWAGLICAGLFCLRFDNRMS